MRIVDYKVVRRMVLTNLEHAVRTLLEEGWQPTGGIIRDPSTDEYMQAVVRYADEPSPLLNPKN